MEVKTDIHPIQADILCNLLLRKSARFSELNKNKISSDQFSFHLKQLLDWRLIEKNINRRYELTSKGKEYANRFDTDKNEIERCAKISVLLVGIKENKYLIQQRLKQPYYGFYGFITGKIKWGETLEEAALREFKEETGMSGRVKLVGIKHKMDYHKDNDKLLEDKYFFVFKVINCQGKLLIKFASGKNKWMTRSEILKINKLFDGVAESMDMVKTKDIKYSQQKYKVYGY